jgi:hypothetical protein
MAMARQRTSYPMLWLNFSARTYALAFALLGCTVQTGITAWGALLQFDFSFPVQ